MPGLETPSKLRRSPGLHVHDQGDRLLVARIVDGVADLEALQLLDAEGRRLWRKLGDSFDRDALRDAMPRADEKARERFLSGLVRTGLVIARDSEEVDPTTTSTARDEGSGNEPDFVGLARELLYAGHRIRFRAHGRSMRPFVPDGSLLEVAPLTRDPRRGDLLLYSLPEHGFVAHRVVGSGSAPEAWRTLGDSSVREDRPHRDAVLGLVTHRITRRGRRLPLARGWRRVLAPSIARLVRGVLRVVGALVIRPFQRSLRRKSLLRSTMARGLRLASGVTARIEARLFRIRKRMDILRAASLNAEEKDRERSRLYARRSVREFTAREENLEAGLTLIEEVLIERQALTPSRLLVLGCGPGRESVALARRGHTVVGLDRDEGMLEHAHALAQRHDVAVRFVPGDAMAFDLEERFEGIVIFSGLINMVLPRERRVALLRCAAEHLEDQGRVYLTFLSGYLPANAPRRRRTKRFLEALNPEHSHGDRFLLNEVVHIHPHPDALAEEAEDAGLEVVEIFRDQRAYDRAHGQVRGYAVLRKPG